MIERRVRWTILGFLTALFCTTGTMLVLYSMGYRLRLDTEEGKPTLRLEENGLILLESTPPGATISIDSLPTKLKTPASIYRPAPSQCTITLSLDGHQPWTRTFQVQPQTVSRVEKIVLSPSRIEPQPVTATEVSCFALSADGKWLAWASDDHPASVWLKDTTSNEEPVKISLHAPHSSQPGFRVKNVEFGPGNRSALLTIRVGNLPEQIGWLSLHKPYEFVNLKELVAGGEIYKINARAPHQVFVVAAGQLHRIDAKERTVQWGISRDVEAIEVGDEALWLLKKGAPSVWVRPFNSNDPADDRELLECSTPLPNGALEPTRRIVADGSRNAAILLANGGALLRDDTRKLGLAFQGARQIAFSPDHRWVAVADATSVRIVEAFPLGGALSERSSEPKREMLLPYRAEDATPITQIFWWDDSAHVLVRRGKILELIETDAPLGGNRHVLLDNLPEHSAVAFDAKEAIAYFTKRSETTPTRGMLLYAARLRAPPKRMLEWLLKPKPPPPAATLSGR